MAFNIALAASGASPSRLMASVARPMDADKVCDPANSPAADPASYPAMRAAT